MEYFDIDTILSDKIKKILNKNENNLNNDDKFKKSFYESIYQDLNKKIPKEIGELLIKENNNPNYTILIHRTSMVSKDTIFNNGLIIAGGNDLNYTTSRYKDNISLLISVVNAYGYKNKFNDKAKCIVMKIPNTALKYVKGETKPILYQTNNIAEQGGGTAVVEGKYQTILLPEYILGCIEYDNENLISNFEFNPNYKEIHNYKNDGLVCPEETIDSYKKQCIKKQNEDNNNLIEFIKQQREENKIINNIICKQNTEFENNPNRTENDIKDFSKKELNSSTFNKITNEIKKFFSKNKEENNIYVDR